VRPYLTILKAIYLNTPMKYKRGCGFMTNSKCPRCGSEGIEIGTPVIPIGKTRTMRIRLVECPKCMLVYHEKLIE